jgi:hypothetical protein
VRLLHRLTPLGSLGSLPQAHEYCYYLQPSPTRCPFIQQPLSIRSFLLRFNNHSSYTSVHRELPEECYFPARHEVASCGQSLPETVSSSWPDRQISRLPQQYHRMAGPRSSISLLITKSKTIENGAYHHPKALAPIQFSIRGTSVEWAGGTNPVFTLSRGLNSLDDSWVYCRAFCRHCLQGD